MKHISYNKGLINTLVLVVVALMVLGYFKIDVRSIATSAGAQENLAYAWEVTQNILKRGLQEILELISSLKA